MTSLVTGATGLLGNNLVRLLLEQHESVRVLVRQTDPQELAGLAVERVLGDVTDPDSLEAALADVDVVYHSAGYVRIGAKHQKLHDQVNHQGTRNVAQAAWRSGARLLNVSSINALGVGSRQRAADEQWTAGPNVDCPYVNSKQRAEAALEVLTAQGLHAVTVYPGLMFGPWDWKPSSGQMILEVARLFTPLAPCGGISVCDVRDVAQAAIHAIHQAPTGRSFVLAGTNLTYFELWKQIAQVTGGRPPWAMSGPLMRWGAAKAGDWIGYFRGEEPPVNSAAVAMSSLFHYFNSDRAVRELQYQIRPVSESLTDAWQWFVEHHY